MSLTEQQQNHVSLPRFGLFIVLADKNDITLHCICSRLGEGLEENLPNLESIILTNNSIQELGDLDNLASVTSLTTLRYHPVYNLNH